MMSPRTVHFAHLCELWCCSANMGMVMVGTPWQRASYNPLFPAWVRNSFTFNVHRGQNNQRADPLNLHTYTYQFWQYLLWGWIHDSHRLSGYGVCMCACFLCMYTVYMRAHVCIKQTSTCFLKMEPDGKVGAGGLALIPWCVRARRFAATMTSS